MNKQIEERLELSEVIDYAMRDWDNYIDECREEEIQPIDTFEEYIADAVLDAGYRKQEWISVEERLPESSCECLVVTNIGGIYKVNYSHRYKAFNALDTDEAKYAMLTVTHWMPLPMPPKGDDCK